MRDTIIFALVGTALLVLGIGAALGINLFIKCRIDWYGPWADDICGWVR